MKQQEAGKLDIEESVICALCKILDDKVDKYEMDGLCNMNGVYEKCKLLGSLNHTWKDNIKMTFGNWVGRRELDSSGL